MSIFDENDDVEPGGEDRDVDVGIWPVLEWERYSRLLRELQEGTVKRQV